MKRGCSEDHDGESTVRKTLRTVLQSKKQNSLREDVESKETPVICAVKDVPVPSPLSSNDSSCESQSSCDAEILKRRERNRLAAQKCRQNRKNRIEDLESQCSKLEQDSEVLLKDITDLRRQKEQLERLLESHTCVMDVLKA